MLMYDLGPLSADAQGRLEALQEQVNSMPSHADRYAKADHLFSAKRNKTFDEVRARLFNSSPAGQACYYCERDRYRDIEHIKPKRHFPEECFNWSNYVYACAICNQDKKGDKYGIINERGELTEFDRSWPVDVCIPKGRHALIDIRRENPFDFLMLDLETGLFLPSRPETPDALRAEFTIKLFNLGDDNLSRIRRQAVWAFADYLRRHMNAAAKGNQEAARRILTEIKELPHPTVLAEIRRQKEKHTWIPPLMKHLPADVGRSTVLSR